MTVLYSSVQCTILKQKRQRRLTLNLKLFILQSSYSTTNSHIFPSVNKTKTTKKKKRVHDILLKRKKICFSPKFSITQALSPLIHSVRRQEVEGVIRVGTGRPGGSVNYSMQKKSSLQRKSNGTSKLKRGVYSQRTSLK